MVDGSPTAIATAREIPHERHRSSIHEIKNRQVVEPNAGERCCACLKILRPHRAQTHNVNKETEGVSRAIHPQHDVVNVHNVSVSPHFGLAAYRRRDKTVLMFET